MQFLMHPASLVQATQPLWAEVMALGTFLGRPNLRGRFRTSLTHGRRCGTNLNFEKAMFFWTFFTPLKINMEPKMKVWKMIILLKQVMFRFHVNFPGCTTDCVE